MFGTNKKHKLDRDKGNENSEFMTIGSESTSLVASFLSNADAHSLKCTSRFYRTAVNAMTERRELKKLAHYMVVAPNEEKVAAILTQSPHYIEKVIAFILDNANRQLINNTVLQLSTGADDWSMFKNAIEPAFIKHYGNEQIAQQKMGAQKRIKFTENKEEEVTRENKIRTHFNEILRTTIQAIDAEQFDLGITEHQKWILNPKTIEAINTFRSEFAKSLPDRIENGMHFFQDLFLESITAFSEIAGQWNYDYKRCALFEDGVASCVFLAMPANKIYKYFAMCKSTMNSENLFTVQQHSQDFELDVTCVDIICRLGERNSVEARLALALNFIFAPERIINPKDVPHRKMSFS